MKALPVIPTLLEGDNLEILKTWPDGFVDLAYLDPPFFTGRDQCLFDRTLSFGTRLSFKDVWENQEEYLEWVSVRVQEVWRVLKASGSIFLHCDWHASHLLRVMLDEIFKPNQFRGEIIWYYKRWSNSLKSFQRAHQVIYFYSKTESYKFNPTYESYSFTTNVDQIWQKRARDENGRCITPVGQSGEYLPLGNNKHGVPMRDVWEIPYLNPRAKERTGWPTQKPLELLRRIILAITDKDDLVLDPVCGSGTTLVAAKALDRNWIGIDSSKKAIQITKQRLSFKTNPFELNNHHTPYQLSRFLRLNRSEKIEVLASLLDMHIVQRNSNIDGFLKTTYVGTNIFVRYLENEEPLQAIRQFVEAVKKKQSQIGIIVMPKATKHEKAELQDSFCKPIRVSVIDFEDISRVSFSINTLLHE